MAKKTHTLIEPISFGGSEISSVTLNVTGRKLMAFEEADDGGLMKNALAAIELFCDLPEGAAGDLDIEDIDALNKMLDDVLPSPAPTERAPDGAEASSQTAQQS